MSSAFEWKNRLILEWWDGKVSKERLSTFAEYKFDPIIQVDHDFEIYPFIPRHDLALQIGMQMRLLCGQKDIIGSLASSAPEVHKSN